MKKEELAALLDGREYMSEMTQAEERMADENALVVVYGYSDDNVELRGFIDDEIGAWGGATVYLTKTGLLENKCSEDDCPYFMESLKTAAVINAIPDRDGYSWVFETAIPHAMFEIVEDGEKYCRGIVFAMADVV